MAVGYFVRFEIFYQLSKGQGLKVNLFWYCYYIFSLYQFLGNILPLGANCSDFFKLGIIPNQGSNQCLNLVSNIGETINCCYNSIITSNDGKTCPENALGVENRCYSINKQNKDPLNETVLDSETECQRNGGNLIQFSSTQDIDIMADMFMSHPKDSFFLVQESFHVGVFSNPHFPFLSTSSGKALQNTSVDPRYLNETANEAGECTVMEYFPSFEDDYTSRTKNQSIIPKSSDFTNKTEWKYWEPKHAMNLTPRSCDKEAYSICDHKDALQAEIYNLSSATFMDSNKMQNVVGFYVHPMNSLTACIAYCVSIDDVMTIIIHGKTCMCTKGMKFLRGF